ncbi:translation initiation factor IF-2 subunit alpha [Candidatus Woesearchaeota archaeon]|nr:translation initiation factor IF-2 subunit alpha [Candidatus Woesearchaeota archaeon]
MLYRKEGIPEEDELVLCTVTNVQHHSVFAKLDEYGKTGMIHISEVSPGRIRNIRDYVVEGKKIICKVLRIDPVKGHIDLSLRRVNEGQKKKKLSEIKQEQKAEKIIEGVARKLSKDVEEVYNEVGKKVFEKYNYIHECFNEIVKDEADLEKLGIDKKLAEELTAAVKERIKPEEVEIKGTLTLVSYASNGIEIIKEALLKVRGVDLRYLGAGKYNMTVKAEDYKTAEKIMEKNSNVVIDFIEKNKGEANFERIEH